MDGVGVEAPGGCIIFKRRVLVLGIRLGICEAGSISIHNITWTTKIDNKVAKNFKVRPVFVAELQKGLSNDGHIFYHDAEKKRTRIQESHTKTHDQRKATLGHRNACQHPAFRG
jgi:hypothetical protein